MESTLSAVCRDLEGQGLLERLREDRSAGIVQQVRELLDGAMPPDLEALYRERVKRVGDFNAVLPTWNENPEWRREGFIRCLLPARAAPLFSDGCGSFYGLDLSSGGERPAVYFFDHQDQYERPRWAAGSSMARFLRLLAERDRAIDEGRTSGWELSMDPDIGKCSRAPPIWLAD